MLQRVLSPVVLLAVMLGSLVIGAPAQVAQREVGAPAAGSVSVRLLRGQATIGGMRTTGAGEYEFAGLAAGPYTVVEIQPDFLPFSSTPNRLPVNLPEGETLIANFGDWEGLGTWLPLILR